ncbi:MAG: hypothetical protein F6K00_24830 [Leptolyngbya sp. SIOISBB]|nr:hypothetical protein [Leptolyngbya sp. SIOISBB]
MANEEQVALLKQGSKVWNQWREDNPDVAIDLPHANLRDADLSLANLCKADLSNANLCKSNLRKTNFSGANLSGANLSAADLRKAKLNKANLSFANLYKTDLSSASLDFVNLSSASLSFTTIDHANLRNADLSNADLNNARLTKTDLRNANLRSSILRSVRLKSVDLSNADLSSVNFTQGSLSENNLSNANLQNAILRSVNLYKTILCNANFLNANLQNAALCFANLKNSILCFANLKNANLSDANLSDANLSNAILSNAILSNTVLRRTNLCGTDLRGVNFCNLNLSHLNLSNVNLVGAQVLHTNFAQAILTGACIADWQIGKSTVLEGIKCDYIFRTYDTEKEQFSGRLPVDPNSTFAPGEFTQRFQIIASALETIDITFTEGIDWQAFFQSFQELHDSHPDEDISIQGMERKGDAFVVRLEVGAEADKGAIETEVKQLYAHQLAALEAQYEQRLQLQGVRLEDAQRTIEVERQRNTELIGVIGIVAQNQGSKYDMRGAQFAGGFAETVQGDQYGGVINNYGQNADDIVRLLTALRIWSQALPEAQQDDVLMELDALEADLNKPEKPETKRLGKRLQRLPCRRDGSSDALQRGRYLFRQCQRVH